MKTLSSNLHLLLPISVGLFLALAASGQVVNVTATLDSTNISAGASTTLHVLAQVIPSQQTNADRIFSWYVDVLNTNGAAANANYASMLKTASDNDPNTSSTGSSDGANRRGIYDTFLNLPGAGVSSPVELMAIPITGLAAGQARFRIQPGTGVDLSADFLVAPLNGGTPLVGGNYAAADLVLTISAQLATQLSMTVTNAPGGAKGVTLSFPVSAGYNYTVQYRDQLASGSWQPLPGAPHNSGLVFDLTTSTTRFYRLAINPQ